ncbi:MAG: hypothetical protein IKW83_11235 [Muribaculaceae bacterium]|nr:hypothetical protein [Muribaculaceae bacterium]
MDDKLSFYSQYVSLVRSADILLTSPEKIKMQTEETVADIKRYGAHLVEAMPKLGEFPLLAQSLFALIDRNGMTGYLGEFVIDEAIAKCEEFAKVESEVMTEIERMRGSVAVNPEILDGVTQRIQSWRRVISVDNLPHVERFMAQQRKIIGDMYEELRVNEKLGIALAQSEEERRRLIEKEEARRRDAAERELDREEKRRRARENYAKNIRKRKNNNTNN